MEDKEVTETSYSTPHSEEPMKGGTGEDELKDKQIEDKANEALETTCQTEEVRKHKLNFIHPIRLLLSLYLILKL